LHIITNKKKRGKNNETSKLSVDSVGCGFYGLRNFRRNAEKKSLRDAIHAQIVALRLNPPLKFLLSVGSLRSSIFSGPFYPLSVESQNLTMELPWYPLQSITNSRCMTSRSLRCANQLPPDIEFSMPGYNNLRYDRPGGKGGLMLDIKHGLSYKRKNFTL
jgi:hypothetical protein